jgi:hypothetical protein
MLGFDGGGSAAAGAAAGGLNIGDLLALAGAACYSLYIFRISAGRLLNMSTRPTLDLLLLRTCV